MHVKLSLAWLWVGLCGCAGGPSRATILCTPPECAADTSLALVAEVDPPAGAPFVHQEFSSLEIDPNGQFRLTLDPPVTLSGAVRIGTPARPLPATVVATRPSRVPGRPDVYYQSTADPVTGQYTLLVSRNVPHEQYTLRVVPADPSLVPPQQVRVTALADQTIDLQFVDPTALPLLRGTIVDSLGGPVVAMQVKAIDPSSGRAVSTTGSSDRQGAFALRLTATPPPKVLLQATPTPDAALLPSLTREIASDTTAPVTLRLPPLPAPSRLIFKLSGTSQSGADQAVSGASCLFTADVSDPHATDGTMASYHVSATSDGAGQVEVALLAAESGNRTYFLQVTPDSSSAFGQLSTQVHVGPQGGYGESIQLQLRPQLSGQVRGPDGVAVRGLTVVPSQSTLAVLPPVALTLLGVAQQAVADADGRFALRLDPGTWDVGLFPPPDSMLPRRWLSGTKVEADTDIGTLILPRGVLVHGRVADPDGRPLPQANVRLYTVAAADPDCPDGSCLLPPRLRAEGSTDTEGQVALILSGRPQ